MLICSYLVLGLSFEDLLSKCRVEFFEVNGKFVAHEGKIALLILVSPAW